MIKTTITAVFCTGAEEVWRAATDLEGWSWRSDLVHVKPEGDGIHFIVEYTRKGTAVRYSVAEKETAKRFVFEMENQNLSGRCTGDFQVLPEGGTKIRLTEEVMIKKKLLYFLACWRKSVQRMQQQYILDLKRHLGEMS